MLEKLGMKIKESSNLIIIMLGSYMKTVHIFLAIFCFMAIPFLAYGQSSNWVAPKSADTLSSPYKFDNNFVKMGAKEFKTNCTACHGRSGKGNGPASIALNPRPANLTSDNVQAQPVGALFWKIEHGKGAMPTWGKSLKPKQVWALVSFIKTDLSKKHK